MTLLLIVPHRKKCEDDDEPVKVVRDDGAISCRVLPTEQGIEYTPSTAAILLSITALPEVSKMVNAESSHGKQRTLTCQTL